MNDDISTLVKSTPVKSSKNYTLEELGLKETKICCGGKWMLQPSIFLKEFYEKKGVDYTQPLEIIDVQKYRAISSTVQIKNWDYKTDNTPPLFLLEQQLLRENKYTI